MKGTLSKQLPKVKKYILEKHFWDWLELGAVPIFLIILGSQFQNRENQRTEEQNKLEKQRAQKQAKLEKQIAQNNLAEKAIQTYLKSMGDILLNKGHREELFPKSEEVLEAVLPTEKPAEEALEKAKKADNHVGDVVRALTIAILRRLENEDNTEHQIKHQAVIFRFLHDVELHKSIFKKANLSEANLEKANLEKANLKGANLEKANLKGASLIKADLSGADLEKANLKGADLEEANLKGVNVKGANLKGAYLGDILNSKQIKSACFWDKAIYTAGVIIKQDWGFVLENERDKQDNTNYIEELKKDKSSDPKELPDCSRWK